MKCAPQGHYNLNGGSLVGSTLHDLNTIDSRNPEIDNITDTDRDAPTGDELDNDEDSTSGGVCNLNSLLLFVLLRSFVKTLFVVKQSTGMWTAGVWQPCVATS